MVEEDKANDLIIACQENDLDKVDELLKENATSSTRDPTGKVALHYCAETGSLELVEKIFQGDTSLLDHKDEDGYTPLTFAVIGGNVRVVEFLLSKGADVNNVDIEKHSLVHWATVCSRKDVLEILLKNGALVSLPDLHGAHALHYATQLSSTKEGREILQVLLKNGANLNGEDYERRTPLLWAASCGSQEAYVALIEAGADKKCVDQDLLTSIHCAASRGQAEMIELILKSSSDVQVDARDRNGCSPLYYAATLGHIDCTKVLLNNKANPNFQENKLRTVGHCAAAKGQLATLKLLRHFGASFDMGNHRGDLPIHEAAQAGSIEVVEFLLNVNPRNVDARNHFGRTPLHLAAANGDLSLCKFLIEYGATADALMISKNDVMTALDVAEKKNRQPVVEYLKEVGAKNADRLPNEQIEAFKNTINFKGIENKIELLEATAQTDTPEKTDQSVEVEVHWDPTNEKNSVDETKPGEVKEEDEKPKEKRSRKKETDEQQKSIDSEEKKTRSSKKRSSSHKSKSKKENKEPSDQSEQSKFSKNIKTSSKESDKLNGKSPTEDAESKTNSDESKTGSAKSRDDNGLFPDNEVITAKESAKAKIPDENEESTNKNSKLANENKHKKSHKHKTVVISKDVNGATDRLIKDSIDNLSMKETMNKETSTDPLMELAFLNNALLINNPNLEANRNNVNQMAVHKPDPRKISVEQALFTDNLRTKNAEPTNAISVQIIPIADVDNSAGTTASQVSPLSTLVGRSSTTASTRGLYRKHRNRLCELTNPGNPTNVNRYVEEKRIFQELANLKRMQIQYGRVQERILVQRLMEDFMRQYRIEYPSDYRVETFHAWEQFLYDQLQLLYREEQESVRIKRLQALPQMSMFQKRLTETSKIKYKDKVDSLNQIYGTPPLPLQYAPKIGRSRIH